VTQGNGEQEDVSKDRADDDEAIIERLRESTKDKYNNGKDKK
jgi:hypothetical protein